MKKNYEINMWEKYTRTLKRKLDSGFYISQSDRNAIKSLINEAKEKIHKLKDEV